MNVHFTVEFTAEHVIFCKKDVGVLCTTHFESFFFKKGDREIIKTFCKASPDRSIVSNLVPCEGVAHDLSWLHDLFALLDRRRVPRGITVSQTNRRSAARTPQKNETHLQN